MLIAVLQFELDIPWAHSLKDKRRVVRSVRDRVVRAHRVSIAEVAHQDTLNRATVAVACVGTDGRVLGAVLDKVLDCVRSRTEAEIISTRRDFIGGVDIHERLPERDDRDESDTPDDTPITDEDRAALAAELLRDFQHPHEHDQEHNREEGMSTHP